MNGCTTLFTPDGRLINAIGDAPEDTTVAGFIGPRRALVGVAGLGAVFFGLLSGSASHTQVYSSAAQWTSALTIALLVASFVLGFWMPRRAREQGEAQAAAAEPAPELAGRH